MDLVSRDVVSVVTRSFRQAKYEQAEALYKESLEIRQKTLGNDHVEVARSLHELAELYLK